ncbi:MAG: trimethylamine methyltransferase [Rhodobacteraceae bacterium]|nr:trimethylamine methyltransferase [Paracoccaceae bacterium]
MDDQPELTRRRGRKQRTAARVAPETGTVAPVYGGHYRPLSEDGVRQIHEAALTILEEIGMGGVPDELRVAAEAAGLPLGSDGRLRFPRAWIAEMLEQVPRQVTLHGRGPGLGVQLGTGMTYYATGGMAVRMVDIDSGDWRPSTLQDLYDCARLVEHLPNIQVFNRTCVPSEITDLREFDLSIAYACAAGTRKPLGIGFNLPEHVDDCVAMYDKLLGGDGAFAAAPFTTCNTCAVVPPLTFGEDSTVVAMAGARAGFPVKMTNAAQAGATAPAALAGTMAQTVAESLAGIAMVQLACRGAPVIWANWPFVSDLRSGAFSGGGGEIAVLNAASAQMARWYGLPNCVSGGMTDSKTMDAQYGYEKGMTDLAAGLAGADVIYEATGMIGSIVGCALEAYVIDDEMIASARQTIRGIEVTEESLSVDVIRDVCLGGPGHYLGHAQTLDLMSSAYHYPALADRSSPDAWVEAGRPDLRDGAKARVREILSNAEPTVDPGVEAEICATFPVQGFHGR